MPKTTKDESPNRAALDEFVRCVRMAACFKAALELDIFTPISEGHRSLPALLRVTGYNERGLRLLLDSLASVGLLVKTPFEYSLTPTAEAYLVKGKSAYCGDALLNLLAWDARGQTGRSARTGKPFGALTAENGNRLHPLRTPVTTEPEWQSLVADMDRLWNELGLSADSGPGVKAIAFGADAALPLLTLSGRKMLASVLVVDAPAALANLKPTVEVLRPEPQIDYLEGDWLSAPLPSSQFDLAFVDSYAAFQSLEQNIGTLHHAWEALLLGGQIVLRAFMADDDRGGPGLLPLIGLDVLISSSQGDIYTVTEYRGMLEAAGFFDVRSVADLPGTLVGRRRLPPPPPPPALTVAPDFIPPPETRA